VIRLWMVFILEQLFCRPHVKLKEGFKLWFNTRQTNIKVLVKVNLSIS